MTLECPRNLGHLHQAEHALLHAGTSGGANDQEGKVTLGGLFHQACDLLPHHGSHGATHEAKIHDRQCHGDTLHPTKPCDDGVVQPRSRLAFAQPVGIGTPVFEQQRIGGNQFFVERLKTSRIGNHRDALLTVNAVVVPTVGANAGVGLEILHVDHLATLRTFAPKPIPLVGLLIHLADELTFAAIRKPVEE